MKQKSLTTITSAARHLNEQLDGHTAQRCGGRGRGKVLDDHVEHIVTRVVKRESHQASGRI